MIALDTNVLVRALTLDDAAQAREASRVMRAGPVWLAKSVLLETEWVLRGAYRFDREAVGEAFDRLLGLPVAEIEDRPGVERAVAWYRDGMDFADALHLASSGPAPSFATFDKDLAASAARAGAAPTVQLLTVKRARGQRKGPGRAAAEPSRD